MEYYERLRQIRIDKDEKQETIAKILNTTKQQISKYETGQNEMTVGKLAKLCEYYNVSADYILGLPKDAEWPR